MGRQGRFLSALVVMLLTILPVSGLVLWSEPGRAAGGAVWPQNAVPDKGPEQCEPLRGVEIEGPGMLLVGQTGWYTSTYTPPTATLPVTQTWDNGTLGPVAAYSWTLPGSYTLTVTATNPCSMVSSLFSVEVCQEPVSVTVGGPEFVDVGEEWVYTATVWPVTASEPLEYRWDNGVVGRSAVYRLTEPGWRAIGVTVTNSCGATYGEKQVRVWGLVYLPLVSRQHLPCFPGPWEIEDNDTPQQANGPLCPQTTYLAMPNDQNDYFYFFQPIGGPIRVQMWDYIPGGYGQLILYDARLNVIARDWDPSDGWWIVANVPPGRYYIRVYTAQGFANLPYQLHMAFPGFGDRTGPERCPRCD